MESLNYLYPVWLASSHPDFLIAVVFDVMFSALCRKSTALIVDLHQEVANANDGYMVLNFCKILCMSTCRLCKLRVSQLSYNNVQKHRVNTYVIAIMHRKLLKSVNNQPT